MLARRLIFTAAVAAALLTPSAAVAALPQQGGLIDLAAPGANPILAGATAGDNAGTGVAAAGDVNGDGLPDSVVAAPLADANGRTDSGSVYVVYGRSSTSGLDLRTLLAAGGFRIDGGTAGDRFGSAVAAGGDVNGDGYADLVVGAPQADPSGRANAGSTYVIYGAPASANVDAAALGTRGFRVDGAAAGDLNGTAVAGGTDVSGDGRPDVATVSSSFDPTTARRNAGAAYVVTTRANTDLASSYAMRADAPLRDDTMSAVAFVPGSRLAVGAPAADPAARASAGSAWIVPSRIDGAVVDLTSASPRLDGAVAGDALGTLVRTIPDVSGDGQPELVVGATGADANARTNSGSLLFVNPATAAIVQRIDGAAASDALGSAIAAGGDLNEDGRRDLVVGSPRSDSNGRTDNGAVYVLPGLAGSVDLLHPPAGTIVARGAASNDRAGSDAAPIGDATGDGHDDLLVGAPGNDQLARADSGAGYTLLGWGGAAFTYPATLSAPAAAAITPLTPTVTRHTGPVTYAISPALPAGLKLDPATGTLSGTPAALGNGPVAYTVTMNDLAGSVGAPLTIDIGPAAGACTNSLLLTSRAADIVGGSTGGDTIRGGDGADSIDGKSGDDCLFGGRADDALHGGDGDDQVYGDEDDDTISGDAGNDVVDGGSGSDRITGDAGADRLFGASEGDTIDGGTGDDAIDGGAGHDFLSGGDGNDVVHGAGDDDLIKGGDGTDQLFGDDNDDFLDGGRGDDQLHGGLRPDELHGGDGSDQMWGDEDNDLVDGENGDDQLWGGAGFDHLTGAEGSDRLFGDDGADILEGGAGNDVLDGGAGNDRLFPDGGDDVVTGGEGNDQVEAAGGGNDKIATGNGNDTVNVQNGRRDVVNCGAGKDTVVADKTDKLTGCEKKTVAATSEAASKKKKRKKPKSRKSGRSRR